MAKATAKPKVKTPKAPAKPKASGDLPAYVTGVAFAKLIGLSRQRVHVMTKEGVFTQIPGVGYAFAEAVQAYIKFKAEEGARKHQSTSADRLRDRREQKEALRIAREERELIHITEAEAGMQEVCGAVLEFVSGLPARITRDVRERQRIEAICDEGRLRLSDRFAKARRAVRDGVAVAEASDEDAT